MLTCPSVMDKLLYNHDGESTSKHARTSPETIATDRRSGAAIRDNQTRDAARTPYTRLNDFPPTHLYPRQASPEDNGSGRIAAVALRRSIPHL